MIPTTLTKQDIEQWYKEDKLQGMKVLGFTGVFIAEVAIAFSFFLDHFNFWPMIALIITMSIMALTLWGFSYMMYKEYKRGKQW